MDAAALVALVSTIPIVGPYAVWLPVLCIVCSAVDAGFPQPAAGSIWVQPRRLVAVFAISILNAKNAVPAGSPPAAIALASAAEAVIAAETATTPSVTKVSVVTTDAPIVEPSK